MNATAYRTALRTALRDSGSTVWSDDQLDTALRTALDAYSQVRPRPDQASLTLAANGRELDLSGLTGLLEPREIWLPYTAADPEHPPRVRYFIPLGPTTIYIGDAEEPSAGEVARIFYVARHTIDGLDSATATSVPSWHEHGLSLGAAAYAAEARARQISEAENITAETRRWANEWAGRHLKEWQAWLTALTLTDSGPVAWQLPLLGFETFVEP